MFWIHVSKPCESLYIDYIHAKLSCNLLINHLAFACILIRRPAPWIHRQTPINLCETLYTRNMRVLSLPIFKILEEPRKTYHKFRSVAITWPCKVLKCATAGSPVRAGPTKTGMQKSACFASQWYVMSLRTRFCSCLTLESMHPDEVKPLSKQANTLLEEYQSVGPRGANSEQDSTNFELGTRCKNVKSPEKVRILNSQFIEEVYEETRNVTNDTGNCHKLIKNHWEVLQRKKDQKYRKKEAQKEVSSQGAPTDGPGRTIASSFAQGWLGSSKLPSLDHWLTRSHARRSKLLLLIHRRSFFPLHPCWRFYHSLSLFLPHFFPRCAHPLRSKDTRTQDPPRYEVDLRDCCNAGSLFSPDSLFSDACARASSVLVRRASTEECVLGPLKASAPILAMDSDPSCSVSKEDGRYLDTWVLLYLGT